MGQTCDVATDQDATAVYAAEAAVEQWLDLVTPDAPEVTVAGQVFRPDPDPKFSDLAGFARYLDQVQSFLADSEHTFDGRELLPVQVRPRRGATRAVYEQATATIAVPPAEIGGRWALRGLVALHELAHHLYGQLGHGHQWRATFLRLVEAVGQPVHAELLALAYHQEGLSTVLHEVPDSTMQRIAKLLRQGERSANPHERDAFLARAQRLASAASVALAVARAHGNATEARVEPTVERVTIGTRGQRGLARYVRLLLNIAAANDVQCTIMHGSIAVNMHGFPSDLATTKALYESLVVQMVSEFEQFRAAEPAVEEWVWNDRIGRHEYKKPATLSRRLAFYESFGVRVGERLQQARQQAVAQARRAEAAGADSPASGSTDLALRHKEIEVHDYFAARLRAEGITSSWRGDRDSAGTRAPAAAEAGTRAANRVRLGTERALG